MSTTTTMSVHPNRVSMSGWMAFRVLRQASASNEMATIAYNGLFDILKKMQRAGGEAAFQETPIGKVRKELGKFAIDYVRGLIK